MPYTLSVKMSDFTVWRHTWWKNWVNCTVLKGISAGLRTVIPSRLLHRELRSSLRESHSFLSLPADTTMASFQDTFVSSNSFSRSASHDIFTFSNTISYSTFYAFFSSFRITLWHDVASKQQTTALFLSTIVTRTRRHTELTKRLTNLMGNLRCAREHSFQFFVQFSLHIWPAQFNLRCMGPFRVYGAL